MLYSAKPVLNCWYNRPICCRKLALAVAEEDYNLAAQLNSEKQLLAQELPAVSQYTFHQLQQLQTGMEMGSLPQQLLAVRALGKSHLSADYIAMLLALQYAPGFLTQGSKLSPTLPFNFHSTTHQSMPAASFFPLALFLTNYP